MFKWFGYSFMYIWSGASKRDTKQQLYPVAPPYKSAQNPICHKNKPFFIKNTKRINNFILYIFASTLSRGGELIQKTGTCNKSFLHAPSICKENHIKTALIAVRALQLFANLLHALGCERIDEDEESRNSSDSGRNPAYEIA